MGTKSLLGNILSERADAIPLDLMATEPERLSRDRAAIEGQQLIPSAD